MPNVIVVGAQWGDEGKGKIIDLLSSQAKYIVRSQGGNNAGHTVIIDQREFKLHLIPSGILQPHTQCYVCAGTVIDPEVLIQEINALKERGIEVEGRLWISAGAHVIFSYHRIIDKILESCKGERTVGTTGRGIGPCYADKANRIGIRMGEFIIPELFKKVSQSLLPLKNAELTKLYNVDAIDFDTFYSEYCRYAQILKPYVMEVEAALGKVMESKENTLFEGAQGTFLDITSGTYPFVTSSNTISAGICAGACIGPNCIDHTLGVVKAYTTRVGYGPLPTEVFEGEEFLNHHLAREYGTTTKRKRRIGWFDAILVKTAVRMNGLDSIAITKLDVLDNLDHIKICIGYQIDGRRYDFVPSLAEDLMKIQPIYETLAGWKQSTVEITKLEDLPSQARNYLDRITQLCGAPISMISVGPERGQTIQLHDLFAVSEGIL